MAGMAGDAPDLLRTAMVELTVDLIDEGKLIKEINRSIQEAAAALSTRKAAGKTGGVCKVNIEISLGYDKDMRDVVNVTNTVTLKTPKNEAHSMVKEINGHLLCQRDGSDAGDPDQQRLFSPRGTPLGTIDKKTGEVIPLGDVAGRIKHTGG